MVLSEDIRKWLRVAGVALFILGQAALYVEGFTPETEVEVVISRRCLEYITQEPVMRLPSNDCIREIKYLLYRVDKLDEEIANVTGNRVILRLEIDETGARRNH